MSDIVVPYAAKLAVAVRRWIRNTRTPAAEVQNLMADLANQAAFIRAKPVFSYSSDLASIPGSELAERDRWRFAFHAQPFARYLFVQLTGARRDAGTPIKPVIKMTVRDAAGTTVGVATWVFGTSGIGAPLDVPSEFGTITTAAVDPADETLIAELPGDSDYFVTFSDTQYGRLVSAQAWEVSLLPDTVNGYVPNTNGSGSPIYADQRGAIAATARLMHRRYGAQLWSWTVDTTPLALTTSETNVVDATSTAVTTTTPGVTLDMSRRVTLRTTTQGVPVVMWAYFAGVVSSAQAILKDSSGTALVTVDAPYADGWGRGTGYLPASSGKYDLHAVMVGAAGTLSAVSLYELDYTPQTMTVTYTAFVTTAATGDPSDDIEFTVAVADGTHSNVVVVFTAPLSVVGSLGGIPETGELPVLAFYALNPDWTIAGDDDGTDFWWTFTRASMSGSADLIIPAGMITWVNTGSIDCVLTGYSNDVNPATGDTATIVVT